jgi:heptosyltransferase-2
MRILINALSGIGDAFMFSPALSVLKKHVPDARIDMLVMYPQVKEIYGLNKNVEKVFFIDFLNQSKMKSLIQVLKLRKNKYYASINVYPSNRKEYNLINFLLGAKKRIAVRYSHFSRSNLDFLNNCLKDEVKDRHNVLENFDLIKFLAPGAKEDEAGGCEIEIDIENEVKATEFLIDNLLTDKFLVGFHAGSATLKGHINKRWAAEKFVKTAKLLHEKFMARILLFGTESDVNEKIHNEIKSFAFIPNPGNILQSLSIMERCKLFISNDTSLMHIAAGLNIPTVAIFGYTNYKELYPWKNKHVIVRKELECSPCFFNSPRPVQCIYSGEEEFKCKKTIEVEEVVEAAEKLIKEIPGYIKS